jgi:hypothetical protein
LDELETVPDNPGRRAFEWAVQGLGFRVQGSGFRVQG